ncbi:MAG: TerC family protein [Clostridiales bacterium]
MPELLTSIATIIMMDLLLSGDNAAVIGMAICHLPANLRKKAAICGTGVAIILRLIFTVFATVLLTIPYFQAIGGTILLFITWRLLTNNSSTENEQKMSSETNFLKAIFIIAIADLSMAFDNVLAIAGAAHGQPLLVVFGLLLSIPILIYCSTWLANIMSRYPVILWLGGALLLHTALNMILTDTALALNFFLPFSEKILSLGAAIILFAYGFYQNILV